MAASGLLSLLVPLLAKAQEFPQPSDSPPVSFSALPQIFVDQVFLVKQTDEQTLQGSFVLVNQEQNHVGNVGYTLLLISEAPEEKEGEVTVDSFQIFDTQKSSEVISLGSKEQKRLPFSWRPIAVPPGNYRLRVQLTLPNDREVGWADTLVTFQNEKELSFVRLEAQKVGVASQDPITGVEAANWGPLEGPNIDGGESLSIHSLAFLSGSEPITGTIMYEVRRLFSDSQSPQREHGERLTILPTSEGQEVTQLLNAQTEAGAYTVTMWLANDQQERLSTIAEFRYVVRGSSISIVSQTLTKPAFRKGEAAEVTFALAGSADRTSDFQGEVEVSLLAKDQVLGSATTPVEITATNLARGTATIVLQNPICSPPTLRVIVRTREGQEITRQDTPLRSLNIPTCAGLAENVSHKFWWLVGGAGSLVALLTALWLWWRLRKPPMIVGGEPPKIPGALLLIGLLGSMLCISGLLLSQAEANGIQYVSYPGFSIFINSPRHGQEFSSHTIPYEARVTWLSCNNSTTYGNIYLRYLTQGGTIDWYTKVPPSAWSLITQRSFVDPAFSGKHIFYSRATDLRQTIQLPNSLQGQTTIWTFLDNVYSNGVRHYAHDYTWIKLPTPTPQVQINPPSGSRCANQYATQLVSHTPVDNGGPGSHNNPGSGASPNSVLGPPNSDAEDFDNVGEEPGYVTVGFAPGVVVNDGQGDDVIIHLKDFSTLHEDGSPGEYELFTVMGSSDGASFVRLLPETRTPSQSRIRLLDSFGYDIAGRLPFLKFVKIQNLTIANPNPMEGPEIDAIEIVADKCTSGTPSPTPTSSSSPVPSTSPSGVPKQCADIRDNDGDKVVDAADPGCHTDRDPLDGDQTYNPDDDDETDTECSDGKDNNDTEDVLADRADPGCHSDRNPTNTTSYDPFDNDEKDSSSDATPTPRPSFDPGGVIEVD